MSFKSTIEQTLSRKQRGMRIKSGDRFLRGGRYVVILSLGGDGVEWEDVSTGETEFASSRDFRSRFLKRVKSPVPVDVPKIELAWTVASSRRMDMAQRANILRQISRSLSGSDKDEVKSWIMSLMAKSEPKRKVFRDGR